MRGILTAFTTPPPALRGILTGILTGALALTAAPGMSGPEADVIVRGTDLAAVAAAVAEHGGTVELEIGLIDAVSAHVPSGRLAELRADQRVVDISVDAPVSLARRDKGDAVAPEGRGVTPTEAMHLIGGGALAASAHDGTGIDVAVVDSGVARVAGLEEGKVVSGVNLALDDVSSKGKKDGYGHGTVMAGIIAGRTTDYRGVAPDARIIDVKVANDEGMVDVSQVLAGIDWVVSNRNTDGRNIRVLSLSFGTDGTNPYSTSPLSYAVEAAWRNGIVVVAAAGNHGAELGRLTSPAIDPYVIAVGAVNLNRTADMSDDTVPAWSASGDGVRNPDLVAPGRSVLGIRSADSKIDNENPDAYEGGFLLGSGTSHATAFTAGVVAAMLEDRPSLKPDEVKALLVGTARNIASEPSVRDGAGALDLGALYGNANLARTPRGATQSFSAAAGTGSLDGDRGSFVLEDAAGNVLRGENTVVGPFDREAWRSSTWSGSTWSGSTWSGSTWSGSTWSGSTWSGSTWSGSTWSGSTWSGSTWSGSTWSGVIWGQ